MHTYYRLVKVKGLKVIHKRMGNLIKIHVQTVRRQLWAPTTLTHNAVQVVRSVVSETNVRGLNYRQKCNAPKNNKSDRPRRPLDYHLMGSLLSTSTGRKLMPS